MPCGSNEDIIGLKPILKPASTQSRFSRYFSGNKRPVTSKIRSSPAHQPLLRPLRAASGLPKDTQVRRDRKEEPHHQSSRFSEDWVTSMRVRLESRSVSMNSLTDVEPQVPSKNFSSSQSLSLLPLARDVTKFDFKPDGEIDGGRNQSTTGRTFRFTEEGFNKARGRPYLHEPTIKIAVEGDRFLSTEKNNSLVRYPEETIAQARPKPNTSQSSVNTDTRTDPPPRPRRSTPFHKNTSYREDFINRIHIEEDNRRQALRPCDSIKTGVKGPFQDRVTSKEDFPARPYCRTIPLIHKDQLAVSKPSINMSNITTYRKYMERPNVFQNLRPSFRFDRQYKHPDNIDWI